MYTQLNQYHVVMEVEPEVLAEPDGLRYIYVRSTTGELVPLSAFTHYAPGTTSLAVNHQGQFPSVTISFNLPRRRRARRRRRPRSAAREQEMRVPAGHPRQLPGHGAGLPGLARQRAASSSPRRSLAVYIVLGILYESLIHPSRSSRRCPRRASARCSP